MISKQARTLEVYLSAGAMARLYNHIFSEAIHALSPVSKTADIDKLINLANKGTIARIISNADANLFTDHPEIGHDYVNVFYGGLIGIYSDIDADIMTRIKKYIDDLSAAIKQELTKYNERRKHETNQRI